MKLAFPVQCRECVQPSKTPMQKAARFSRCRSYRYALWRIWDEQLPSICFIGLNPSTADERRDDPTLTRCMAYAKNWGYGGVCIGNLFALRATDPRRLRAARDPVGPYNNRWLKQLAGDAVIVVAAWGNDGVFLGRDQQVRQMLPGMYCLKMNRSGQPAHPLYQRADLQPVILPD